MKIVKLFIGAYIMIELMKELVRSEVEGNNREGVIKIGMLMVFEMWILGG